MKKSLVVSTPEADFAALSFKDDINTSFYKVAKLGFDAIELSLRNPHNVRTDILKNLVLKYDLPIVALATGRAYGEEGLSFTDKDQKVREMALARIKEQILFASHFDAFVIIGLIRGKIQPEVGSEKAEEYFMKAMKECADFAGDYNVTLVVEPINRYETNLYNTINETVEVIRKIGRDNIQVLADTFHMNIEEPDIYGSIFSGRDYIKHFHVADSNRWAPGCGHLNFREIFDTLQRIGYKGAVSAEILPRPTPDESAVLTIEHLKKLGL